MDWKFARIRKYLVALFAALSTIFVVFNISFFLWRYSEFRYFVTGLLRQNWLIFLGFVVLIVLLPFALTYRSHISNIAAKVVSFVTRNRAVSLLGVLVALALVLWYLLMWLLPEPSSQYDPTKDAIDFEIKILGGIVILFAAYAAWRRVNVMEKGQVTERFTRAIDQLGATDIKGELVIEIRLGGIFALEQIARENLDEYHSPIIEILTAYVRKNAPWTPKGEGKEKEQEEIKPREDIQAVLTVIGRRKRIMGHGETEQLNLNKIDIRGANLNKAHLEGVALEESNLSGTKLWMAHLDGAFLNKSKLCGANLWKANLRWAELKEAHLERAHLFEAHLERAHLGEANLEGANLWGANLEGANLVGADLERASLVRAIGLTIEQLSGVKTLYKAYLNPGLEEEVRGKCKHLLDGASFRKTR